MWIIDTIKCCGTLSTNINTLGIRFFFFFVKQEVELNIPKAPTGSKLLCVALRQCLSSAEVFTSELDHTDGHVAQGIHAGC